MKFDVYMRVTCHMDAIEAKNEESAKKKAMALMLKQAKKEDPYTEQLYFFETEYKVDRDDYYDLEEN